MKKIVLATLIGFFGGTFSATAQVYEGNSYVYFGKDFVYKAVVDRYSGGDNAKVVLYGYSVFFGACGSSSYIDTQWVSTNQLWNCSDAKKEARRSGMSSTLRSIMDCGCR